MLTFTLQNIVITCNYLDYTNCWHYYLEKLYEVLKLSGQTIPGQNIQVFDTENQQLYSDTIYIQINVYKLHIRLFRKHGY